MKLAATSKSLEYFLLGKELKVKTEIAKSQSKLLTIKKAKIEKIVMIEKKIRVMKVIWLRSFMKN